MTSRTDIAKSIVESCLERVGLKKTLCPEVYELTDYASRHKSVNTAHIVLDQNKLVFHDSYSEPAGTFHRENKFDSIESFLGSFIETNIQQACTAYMATAQNGKFYNFLKKGNHEGFSKERKRVEAALRQKLENHLKSPNLKAQIMDLSRNSVEDSTHNH